ncbi:MAG: inositol monophosphatase family protein [Candidatus Dormibacteria bacterium]
MDTQPELSFLLELQELAEQCVMPFFKSRTLLVETKEDGSPATEADTAVERLLRSNIQKLHPHHSILGEEFGATTNPASDWRWIIDPIDGTRSFLRGNETWAILIAVQFQQQTVMSAVSFPALGQRYHAVRGNGAHSSISSYPLHVSTTPTLEQAVFSHSGFHGNPDLHPYEVFIQKCWDVRGLGNAFSHVAVARGTADVALSLPFARLWDFTALDLLVTEAGGVFETAVHTPFTKGGALSSNSILHEEAREILKPYLASMDVTPLLAPPTE